MKYGQNIQHDQPMRRLVIDDSIIFAARYSGAVLYSLFLRVGGRPKTNWPGDKAIIGFASALFGFKIYCSISKSKKRLKLNWGRKSSPSFALFFLKN